MLNLEFRSTKPIFIFICTKPFFFFQGTVNEMTDVVQNSNHTRNEFENAAHNIGDNEQDFKSGAGGRAVNEVFANLRDQNEGSVPST